MEMKEAEPDEGRPAVANAAGKGKKPDLRVVQPQRDAEGQTKFKSVGGLWRNLSKNGNTFYTLKIGSLSLLAFPNDVE